MNEENRQPVDDNVSAGDRAKSVLEKILAYKKVLLVILVVVLAIVLLNGSLFSTKKGVIKDFVKAGNTGNGKKLYKTIDMAGISVMMEMQFGDKDLEDFYDEYKEFVKSDEWKEAEEELDEQIDEAIEDMEEPDDDEKIKIKEFGDIEKEGKNIWKVEVTLVSKEDKDNEIDVDFYLMKKGFKYYIVGMDGMSIF